LTTYNFCDTELWRARPPGESNQFESRREKVEAVSNRALIEATLVVVSAR
jgi:hypothetical protein